MAFKLQDFVKETSSVVGTGDIACGGAVANYNSFASFLSNGDTTFYSINIGSAFETGIGTYNTGANSITRTTVLSSSNAGVAVSFAAGTKTIICGLPSKAIGTSANNLVQLDATGKLPAVDGSQLTGLFSPSYSLVATSGAITSGATVIPFTGINSEDIIVYFKAFNTTQNILPGFAVSINGGTNYTTTPVPMTSGNWTGTSSARYFHVPISGLKTGLVTVTQPSGTPAAITTPGINATQTTITGQGVCSMITAGAQVDAFRIVIPSGSVNSGSIDILGRG